MLDGEIVCLDPEGKTQFRDLLFRRGEPRFYSFDLLWCEGADLRISDETQTPAARSRAGATRKVALLRPHRERRRRLFQEACASSAEPDW